MDACIPGDGAGFEYAAASQIQSQRPYSRRVATPPRYGARIAFP